MPKPDFDLIWQGILDRLIKDAGEEEVEIPIALKEALELLDALSDEEYELWILEVKGNRAILEGAIDELKALSYEEYAIFLEELLANPERMEKAAEEITLLPDEENDVRLAKFCTEAILSSAQELDISSDEVALLEISNPGLQRQH